MSASHLLDHVAAHFKCKNDAAVCRLFDVMPPAISNLRRGRIPFGPTYIVRLHEMAPEVFPVKRIRQLLEV
jgi:hypothetical protein